MGLTSSEKSSWIPSIHATRLVLPGAGPHLPLKHSVGMLSGLLPLPLRLLRANCTSYSSVCNVGQCPHLPLGGERSDLRRVSCFPMRRSSVPGCGPQRCQGRRAGAGATEELGLGVRPCWDSNPSSRTHWLGGQVTRPPTPQVPYLSNGEDKRTHFSELLSIK